MSNIRLFISFLITFCFITVAQASRGVAYIGREKDTDTVIDDGWRFIRTDAPLAAQADFDDSSWQKLNLPHTWNNYDGQDGGNNYYRGPGWYRRHLKISKSKNYFLRFDGAATVTDVYVNGQHVGQHRGNWSAFCFDITSALHHGDNVIAIRVDNSRFDDVPPLSGDFTVFGGLYRDVHLLTLGDVGISPTDDASPGVYIHQDKVKDDSADLTITTKLRNAVNQPRDGKVIYTIYDAKGKSVAASVSEVSIPPTGSDAVANIHLDHPHLWDGRNDPYLYRVVVRVESDGKVVDQITQPLGLRYFRFDPDQGFFLDGKHYPLHGVNRHQDRLNKGWAIGQAEHDQDMAIILEMGSTGIRLAHYEHADYFYHLCDQNGLVVWAEFGLINKINRTPAFYDCAKQELRELIKQNFNHPSIVMWGMFNEVGFGKQHNPRDWELIEQLSDEAHKLDDTRVTTAASNQPFKHPANWITDIIAFNWYLGWYQGSVNDWPAKLDQLHAFQPNRCIGISEYGAGASIDMHQVPALKPAKASSSWHPEEYQSLVHEAAWRAFSQRPWIWGTFLWNQFDFAADQRNEGDTPGRNDKGLVTYDRKVRKDAFYFYKANWTSTPVIHINSSRYNPRPAGATTIKIYSNCDNVELFVNGKSLGKTPGQTCVFTWDATLLPGINHAKAVGYKDGKTFHDEVSWQCKK
ncbi:MAG TPA: glycoside hydrolase family 2 TIM barrel-domain containing protein [Tepidisphaeraceae bacterium]|jgi:beta-galactosidase